jgi:hypothetical protein
MRAVAERAIARARVAWTSERVRLVVLTAYYLAILAGLVAVRSAHLPPTRFVYQQF